MSELECPECGAGVPVGEFPVEEGKIATCPNCKQSLAVAIDESHEWVSPSGECFSTATLIVNEDEEDDS